jgi:putative ABC transport system permease protein
MAGMVTSDLFHVLGSGAHLGRTFTEREEFDGAPLIVLTDELWARQFHRAPDIVGRTVQLNEQPYEAIGILPPDFVFPAPGTHVDAYIPISHRDYGSRAAKPLQAVARLKPGATFASAQAELRAIGARLATAWPEDNARGGADIESLDEAWKGNLRRPLLLLTVAALLLLAIVCTNVVNLILARSLARAREMEIRTALGAGLADILRQLLAEALLLCAAGGALGLLLAGAVLRGLPIVLRAAIEGLAIDTARWFSRPPSVCWSRSSADSRRRSPRAAIAIRSACAGPGGRPDRAQPRAAPQRGRVSPRLPQAGQSQSRIRQLARDVFRIRPSRGPLHRSPDGRLPSPSSARGSPRSPAWSPPARSGACRSTAAIARRFQFEGAGLPPPNGRPSPSMGWTPRTFPRCASRCSPAETLHGTPTASIIRQPCRESRFRKKYERRRRCLGKRVQLRFWTDLAPKNQLWQIVGVVGDTYQAGLDQSIRPQIYLPISQTGLDGGDYVIRTTRTDSGFSAAVAAAVRSVDPNLERINLRRLDNWVRDSLGDRRLPAILATLFAAIGLSLTALGLYGTIALEMGSAAKRWRFALPWAQPARRSRPSF